ncbi:DNA gyrase inhibitor YacG [Mariniblastus fucicola]|uniref:DNA gyrase inhibitor YacG n=1 Tax=Mariniblastus fucicola TaxID=980251 RepID=A0A5B9PE87_9BACT|nr:DNA gyrase inhibitor YacG [Mariniblastus fucicola]QEG21263.1 zinc-binding protein [Mariniblastus fucicola]
MYENSEASKTGQGGDSPESSSKKTPANSTLFRCAYCGRKTERSASPCMPFCSVRCHRADLGMWLNESYGLPWDGEGEREQIEE